MKTDYSQYYEDHIERGVSSNGKELIHWINPKIDPYDLKYYRPHCPGYIYYYDLLRILARDLAESMQDTPYPINTKELPLTIIALDALDTARRFDPTLKSRECQFYAIQFIYTRLMKIIIQNYYAFDPRKTDYIYKLMEQPYFATPSTLYQEERARLYDAQARPP